MIRNYWDVYREYKVHHQVVIDIDKEKSVVIITEICFIVTRPALHLQQLVIFFIFVIFPLLPSYK